MDASSSGTAGGREGEPRRTGFQRACRLPNTVHSEIARALSLLTLPATPGAFDLDDHDEPDRPIARYIPPVDHVEVDPNECSLLWREVLKHNSDAFKFKSRTPQPPS